MGAFKLELLENYVAIPYVRYYYTTHRWVRGT